MRVVRVDKLLESYAWAVRGYRSYQGKSGHMHLAMEACFMSCIAKSLAADAARRKKLNKPQQPGSIIYRNQAVRVQDVLGRFCLKQNSKLFGFRYDASINRCIAASIMDRCYLESKITFSDLYQLWKPLAVRNKNVKA